MASVFKEKLSIGYTCAGPTYRESVLKKLSNYYFDDDNIFYCILTDDKSYFDSINRKNLIVNELKDFYEEFPELEKNEAFIQSSDKNDYAEKFVRNGYLFSFSTYRFNILQSIKLGIPNVTLMCTDTKLDFNVFNNNFFDKKNYLYNAVSEWDSNLNEQNMSIIANRLIDKFNLPVDETIRVLDAAGRMFISKDLESLQFLFNVWNDVIEHLYKTNEINYFRGSYVINDEYILAPIYNALSLNKREAHCLERIFDVNHNVKEERFWRTGNSFLEHTNYEEFLRINNL